MLHHVHLEPYQSPITTPSFSYPSILELSRTPQNQLNQSSFEHCTRSIYDLLLSLTRSKYLPQGLQLHTLIIKSGLLTSPFVFHSLINFYSKSQLPLDSLRVFEEAPHKSSVTWSSIISSFSQNELPLLSLEFFRRMRRRGFTPDHYIYPSAAKSSATLVWPRVGKSLHSLVVKAGFVHDVYVGNSVVNMYGKCWELNDARKLFDEMPVRNIVSWNGMISGCTQMGEDEEALVLLKQVLVEDLEITDFTFALVRRALWAVL